MGNKQSYQPYVVSDRIPLGEWDADFKSKGTFYKNGPVMERQCNDICCVVTFFILLVAFIGLGAYFMWASSSFVQLNNPNQSQVTTLSVFNAAFNGSFAGICIGMISLSVVMSFCLLALSESCPKCIIWGLITFSVLLFAAISATGFLIGSIAMGATLTTLTVIYCLILYCCLRGHLETAVVLVGCAGEFIAANPRIYLVGLVVGTITAAFSFFWVFGYLGILTLSAAVVPPFTANTSIIFQVFFWLLYIFFTYFFYFFTVFLVASGVSLWYYKKEVPMLGTALKWLVTSHVGSITFSALLTTLIRALRTMAVENSYNPAQRLCFVIVTSVINSLEYFMKTLNHYATISMAFTGQDYISSARTAGLMIYNNLGMFAAVDIITTFYFYVSIVVCVGIPTALSALLVIYIIPGGVNLVVYMVIAVLMFSMLISLTFITSFTDSLSSVFYLYCLDKRLTETGITLSHCPENIRSMMNDMEIQQTFVTNTSSEAFNAKPNMIHI